MNIFAVDECPFKSAKDLPDKLVVKMPTESIQLLIPWFYRTYGIMIEKPGQLELLDDRKKYYGIKGFVHHPCSKWLYENPSNVIWLIEHSFGLCEEYWARYNGKYHGALFALNKIRDRVMKSSELGLLSSKKHSPFVQAMPDSYKLPDDPVQAYRNYLIGEKGYAEWRHCSPPQWWDSEKHQRARLTYLNKKK